MLRNILLALTWICFIGCTKADSTDTFLPFMQLNLKYGYQLPVGVLSHRFGAFSGVGMGLGIRASRKWHIETGSTLYFSNRVYEKNMFDSIIGTSGDLIDVNGNPAVLRFAMRGSQYYMHTQYVLNLDHDKTVSGICMGAGLGFLKHKIKFLYTPDLLPQLDDDYFKGYDRFTGGLILKPLLGYQHISKYSGTHFHIGIEPGILFARSLRPYQFDLRKKPFESRKEFVFSATLSLSIPLGNRLPDRMNL